MPFDVFAEFLPSNARGKHLLIIEYFWTAGSMMTPLFAYWTLQSSWRLFVILCALPVRSFGGLPDYFHERSNATCKSISLVVHYQWYSRCIPLP